VPDQTEQFDRLKAALADRYRIERELGAGGMATVYLAHDLRHDRKVAIKVLKPELAAVLGAERFVQEIKTTASLQHPHILPLHDSGEAGGFLYYVMPYIEGETLRDKLNRETQLGIEEAIKITTEVADALDYAHRQNVIHRDIKPENILLHDGRPMVADFGIALAVSAAAGGRMTETGLSLGTPHYMSPEQATAEKDLTNRSDIYSFSAVLYEMLTGSPPHVGSSAQQIIMKIVTEEAQPVTNVRKAVPPNVAAAVATALEKLPADRFASAGKFADALSDTAFTSALITRPRTRIISRERVAWSAALLAVAIIALLQRGTGDAIDTNVTRLDLKLADSLPMAFIGSASLGNGRRALTLSPDGQLLAYVAEQTGLHRLAIRPLESYETRVLQGTEGAYNPFFSPDGRWLGFFAGNKLMKVPADGRSIPVALAEVANPMGGHWGTDGYVVFGREGGDIRRVAADGGPVETIRSGWPSLYPTILPDGRSVVVTDRDTVEVIDSETGASRGLALEGSDVRFVTPDYLVFGQHATLFATRFDLEELEIRGSSVPVLSGVRSEVYGAMQWDVSDDGTLVYAPGRSVAEGTLTWVDRNGRREPLPSAFQNRLHGTFQVSPDGRRLAIEVFSGSASDIWVYDLEQERAERLTVDGANRGAIWSGDGAAVAYTKVGKAVVPYIQSIGTAGNPEPLADGLGSGWISAWSSDGELIALDENGVSVYDLTRAVLHEVSPAPDWGGVLAPNDRAIAGGSEEPIWSHDGTKLYYRSGQSIMEVSVAHEPGLSVGTPRTVYRGDFVNVGGPSYGVSPEGDRFLVIEGGRSTTNSVRVVLGWHEELRRLVGGESR
jgi:serine/threonine-protein kinase